MVLPCDLKLGSCLLVHWLAPLYSIHHHRRRLTSSPLALPDPLLGYPSFIPRYLMAAVHNGVRSSPDGLHLVAINAGMDFVSLAQNVGGPLDVIGKSGLTASFRLMRLHEYLDGELGRMLSVNRQRLAKTRLALCERVLPMCLHVGVARLGWGSTALIDILYDTTDGETDFSAFCHVSFDQVFHAMANALAAGD